MQFTGESAQRQEIVSSNIDQTAQLVAYKDAELESFFKRPVRIVTSSWLQASSFNLLFDPWALYFADPRVINRLTNYNLMRCKLCVKFVLSGNPFLYGKLIASYMPYPVITSNSTTTNDGRNPHGTGVPQELILATQRPYVSLTPQESTGACMELPFFNSQAWFQTQNASWVDFGKISMQVMNQLKHANGGTESISVNIFAWAEDIEMAIPTSVAAYGMIAQSGRDEYTGPISKPASILGRAVARARNAPVIAPYALATSVAAGSVASISNLLGYSRPTNLDHPMRMVNQPISMLAVGEGTDNSEKLTIDPKQGVSIDTRVMGLAGEDEMSIDFIARKESYLTTITWPVGAASETQLLSIPVTPMHYAHWGSTPAAAVITPTALAAAALPFKKWRGTLKFRFEVICTPYHKGSVRLLYDPYYQDSNSKFNVNYTKIMDLAECKDFEIGVSWCSPEMVRSVATPNFSNTSNTWSTATQYVPSQGTDNGVLTLLVLNKLTAPQDTINNDVGINVYVRAGDDFELYEPINTGISAICMVPQSGYENFEDEDMMYLTVGHPSDGADVAKVVVGERIVNFRALLKRYAHYCSYSGAGVAGLSANITSLVCRDFPVARGSDAAGIHVSAGLAERANIVTNCLLAYLASMYAGYRGGIRYKHVYEQLGAATVPFNASFVVRNSSIAPQGNINSVALDSTLLSAFALQTSASFNASANGSAITFTALKPVQEIEVPYYANSRFAYVRPLRFNVSGPSHTVTVNTTRNTQPVIHSFISVAEDFNFGFFVGSNLWYGDYVVA